MSIGASDLKLSRYLASGMKKVPGLVRPGGFPLILAIDQAQKAAGIRGHVGEIGVLFGKLFILLYLLRREDERAVAVDDFSEVASQEQFLRHLDGQVGDRRALRLLRADSRRLSAGDLTSAAGGRFRLFSIDGNHAADAVEHDLRIVCGALSPAGVIALDDYFAEDWPGVSEATCRFLATGQGGELVPFAIGANKLFLCPSASAPTYLHHLAAMDADASRYEREFFGHRVVCYNFAPHNILGVNVSRKWANTPAWRALKEHPLGHYIRFRLRRP